MDIVILAAGKGTRLLPFTKTQPKPLLKFGDSFVIELLLKSLPEKAKKVIIVIDYLGNEIIKAIGNQYQSLEVSYVWQDEKLKGTLGALLSSKKQIESDNFLAICSDNLYSKDSLTDLTEIPNSYLVVKVTNEQKKDKYPVAKLSMWQIKNSNQVLLDAGAWYLNKDFFNAPKIQVEAGNELGIPHSMKALSDNSGFNYLPIETNYWYPLGNKTEVIIAENELGIKSNFATTEVDTLLS